MVYSNSMKTKTNRLSKSTIRSSRTIATALDKFAAKLVKRMNRMTENQRLASMQILGNMDDVASFDAALAARTASTLADQIVYVVGTEVSTDNDKILAQFVNDDARAQAAKRAAIRGGRFSNVHLQYAVIR